MKFIKEVQLNESSMSIIKSILSSDEYKKMLNTIRDEIEKEAIDSSDYESMKKKIIDKIINNFKNSL